MEGGALLPTLRNLTFCSSARGRSGSEVECIVNVRELERLIQRAVAFSETDVIELEDLPPTVRGDYGAAVLPSLQRNETVRAWRSRYARLVLDRCHGNKRQACRVLGITYHTLRAYLHCPAGPDGDGHAGTRGHD